MFIVGDTNGVHNGRQYFYVDSSQGKLLSVAKVLSVMNKVRSEGESWSSEHIFNMIWRAHVFSYVYHVSVIFVYYYHKNKYLNDL